MEQNQVQHDESMKLSNTDSHEIADNEYTLGDGWPWLKSKSEMKAPLSKFDDEESKVYNGSENFIEYKESKKNKSLLTTSSDAKKRIIDSNNISPSINIDTHKSAASLGVLNQNLEFQNDCTSDSPYLTESEDATKSSYNYDNIDLKFLQIPKR